MACVRVRVRVRVGARAYPYFPTSPQPPLTSVTCSAAAIGLLDIPLFTGHIKFVLERYFIKPFFQLYLLHCMHSKFVHHIHTKHVISFSLIRYNKLHYINCIGTVIQPESCHNHLLFWRKFGLAWLGFRSLPNKQFVFFFNMLYCEPALKVYSNMYCSFRIT